MPSERAASVGFIGLGMMGLPMASNILKAGHPLVVHDLAPARMDILLKQGAKAAATPAEVARGARITVLMVDTTAQVEQVLFGENGLHLGMQSGDKVISMSTIDPVSVRGFAKRLAERGVGMLDAPVSGMEKGARDGTLKAFVGGEADDLEACRPALSAMASQIIHLGPSGQGLAMKLVNNMMIQIGWVAASEALTLGVKAGLDPRQMVELLTQSTGDSVALRYLAPRWLERDFDGIRLDITFKDIEHQIQLGKAIGAPTMLASVAQQMYQMARCKGYGGEDGVAVVKVYEELAGAQPSAGAD